MAKDETKTEQHTITVGDERVPFEAIVGRNVPLHDDSEES